jgi:serine/threonine protein kinase
MVQASGPTAGPDYPVQSRANARSSPSGDVAALANELAPELEIVRRLGSGSTGEVFLAREPALKRLVAVKMLSPALVGEEVARIRFEREAAAAAALNHANTVTVHRFGYTSAGVPYLVLQYVNGVTLAERLAAEGPLPVTEARRILGDVAAGLAAAHRSGFVHRDIRPGNVLCERDSGRVFVTDFGLAGLLPEAENGSPHITQAGEVLGEPRYISPEQLRGEPVTEGTDVYALGVMGYELLTGESPFRGETLRELSAAHLRSPPRSLESLREDVDAGLADLLAHCLAKEPRKRPGAEYIARKLRSVLREQAEASMDEGHGVGKDFVEDLLRRRLPQVMAITLVVGYAALGFIDQLVDRGVIPSLVYELSLSTFIYSVAASGVISWFHGKRGKQRVSRPEVALLALIATGWVLTCVLITLF